MSSYYTQPMPPHGQWAPPPPPPKKWYQRKVITIPLAVFGAFMVLGLIGQAVGVDNKTTSADGSTATAPTVTVTAPASTAEAVAPAAAAPATTSSAPKTRAPKTTAAAEEVDTVQTWRMPDETGKTLQDAQDHIQSVTDNGIFFTRSNDAMGTGRMQILDSGWQVCSQNVDPGTKIDADTDIVFDVVRVSESCP